MTGFLIKRSDSDKEIKVMEYEKKGYDFKPKIMSSLCEINKITIFNPSMIDIILSKKIEKQFKRVAAITYDVLSSDDDESASDAVIALDDVSKLRAIILNKYQKFLDKEKEKMYIKKLRILENQLRSKIAFERQYIESYEENKGKGR